MTAHVQKLTKAIDALPPQEQAELYAWLETKRAQAWDIRIEADSAAGKLDHLIAEAKEDYSAGRCRSLNDVVNDHS